MQPSQLNNIPQLLRLCAVQITVRRQPYPPHWKSNQQSSLLRESIGKKIRKRRLELHWLQEDVARMLEVSAVSISNWERGTVIPSRRMKKKIWDFLRHAVDLVPKDQSTRLCCLGCGISETDYQLCLFERICKQRNKISFRS
jgi:transcriptional regulator with XRE-family HTH domain